MKVSGCKFIKIIPNAQNQTDIPDNIAYNGTGKIEERQKFERTSSLSEMLTVPLRYNIKRKF